MPMKKTEGPIFEFACHETNYGIANILAGARADEKKGRPRAANEDRSKEDPMRTKLAVVVAAGPDLLAAGPVRAHHAFSAEFDVNKPLQAAGNA